MAYKRLAMAAVAATLATTAAHAQKRTWLETPNWTVWQQPIGSTGHEGCYAKYFLQTESGLATFGFSQNDDKAMGAMHYSEPGLVWTQVGSITLQIDNLSPWRAGVTTNDDRTLLTVNLGPNPTRFVSEVMYGSVLRVTTNNGTRIFPLNGSNQAMQTLFACIGTIVAAQHGDQGGSQVGVAPLPRPLPDPRWSPLPRPVIPARPVVPTAPATEL